MIEMRGMNCAHLTGGPADNRPPRPSRLATLGCGALAVAMAALVALPVVVAATPAAAQEELIQLVQGRASTVRVAPYTTVTVETDTPFANLVVGRPEIADALPLSNTSLYIQGNEVGRTNISVYDEAKQLIGVIDVVVEIDVTELRRAITSIAPRSNVAVDLVNGQIRLSGQVPDGAALSQILDVARQYGGDGVMNAIRVTDSQQVMLEVRFLEASRDSGRELGVGFAGRGNDTNFNIGDVAAAASIGYVNPFSSLITEIIDQSGLSVDLVIRALETKGAVRRLAEPNLVALSGQTAGFLAGGEVPVPQVTGEGDVDVEFKEFGVVLNFTPVVLDDSLVNVNLVAEVSEVDFSNAVVVNGVPVPGFATRRTNTSVELRDGQSFAVSGLLQSTNAKVQNQVPWLGQVPVLGALFRSSEFQKRETDLVVIVTPHIVRPTGPNQVLRTPLDGSRTANDAEFFLLGMLEISDDMINNFETGAGIAGPYGHILELPAADVVAVKK